MTKLKKALILEKRTAREITADAVSALGERDVYSLDPVEFQIVVESDKFDNGIKKDNNDGTWTFTVEHGGKVFRTTTIDEIW